MTPFRCLVADPQWALRDQLPGPTRGAARQYAVRSSEPIMRFPSPPIATHAVLFLQRLVSMQLDAMT